MIEFLSPVSKKVLAHREILPARNFGKANRSSRQNRGISQFKRVKFAIFGIKENRADVNFIGARNFF